LFDLQGKVASSVVGVVDAPTSDLSTHARAAAVKGALAASPGCFSQGHALAAGGAT
jgi:hypothetical protein